MLNHNRTSLDLNTTNYFFHAGTGDVHVSMLAEITPSSDCVSAAAPDGFALSQVLAAEYITELVNTGQSSIAVPGINYSE